jgi:hypothetical protein
MYWVQSFGVVWWKVSPLHFLAVCLCHRDFAGNPWITHESYVFSHFYSIKNVPMHAFGKKNVIYHSLMIDNVNEVTDKRMKALKDKTYVAKAYNKKVIN